MSPYVSPRQVAERRIQSRRTLAGIIVESAYALALFGVGFLICSLASRL
jgi:hypothetical protein